MTKKVEFILPSIYVADATHGVLVGDFNGWNIQEGIALEKQTDGSMKTALVLTTGKKYEYRYLLNDGRWVNDDGDKVVVHVFGHAIENCCVEVPAAQKNSTKTTAKKTASKAPSVTKPAKAAPEKKSVKSQKDDLTKIYGISKKIADLLKTEGIITYNELGKCTMKKLLLMLDSAKIDNKTNHYTSWSKQAKLADAGKTAEWETLIKSLQSK